MKLLLADDQTLLRDSLKYILEKDKQIDVIDSVSNGNEVLESCKRNLPDIVLLDIKMPKLNGIDTAKILKEKYKSIKVIMLTTFENIENIVETLIAGADGYIVKDIPSDELIMAIKCVNSGLHVIHNSVHNYMVNEFSKLYSKKVKVQSNELDIEISNADLEIIKLVAQGKSNKEIAEQIGFAEGTIKNKITRLFEKLDLRDRTQIAIFAIENDLI